MPDGGVDIAWTTYSTSSVKDLLGGSCKVGFPKEGSRRLLAHQIKNNSTGTTTVVSTRTEHLQLPPQLDATAFIEAVNAYKRGHMLDPDSLNRTNPVLADAERYLELLLSAKLGRPARVKGGE